MELRPGNAIARGPPGKSVRLSRRARAESTPGGSARTYRRFRELNAYRARRELQRYEGTGQRDLYRELRERFLSRHSPEPGWVVDLGSGPGRFLPFIGGPGNSRVALDLSREMLSLLPATWSSFGRREVVPERILADALWPPLAPSACAEVVVLGNTLGFAGPAAERLLALAEDLVAPGGLLLLEIAPGPGEHAVYLTRLPPSSVARLLRAPTRAVLARLDREGFRKEPYRRATPKSFRRFTADEVRGRLHARGWDVRETVAVAAALGPDPARIDSVRADPKAWTHLLEIEEEVGRRHERWASAAAVLLSAARAR